MALTIICLGFIILTYCDSINELYESCIYLRIEMEHFNQVLYIYRNIIFHKKNNIKYVTTKYIASLTHVYLLRFHRCDLL